MGLVVSKIFCSHMLYIISNLIIPYSNYLLSGRGKNRRCAYNDGDSEDLSLLVLRSMHPCTDQNCPLASSSTKIEEYINNHRPHGGILKSAFLQDGDGSKEEEEEANDDNEKEASVRTSSEEDGSKTNTRLLESGDDESNLDNGDDDRKKEVDSDEESLFGSDPEESPQGKNSDEEDKKDSPSQLHDAVDSDEESLFSSDGDGEEEVVVDDQPAAGNANCQNEDDGDDSSRFSTDPFSIFDQQQQRPPKRIVVEQKRKIIEAPSLVTKYNIPPEIKIEPTCKYVCCEVWYFYANSISHHKMNPDYYFAHLWGDRMIKRCTPLGSGPPPETLPATVPGGICYEILFSEVISRKGKYAEDKSEFTYCICHM